MKGTRRTPHLAHIYPKRCNITASVSDKRLIVTTLKMGTTQLYESTFKTEGIKVQIFNDFLETSKHYISEPNPTPEDTDSFLSQIWNAFRPEDTRPIIFFIREPFKVLLSGIETYMVLNLTEFLESASCDFKLREKILKHSYNKTVSHLSDIPDELLLPLLNYNLANFPSRIIHDLHVSNDYYFTLLNILTYIKTFAPHILERVLIINLDDYSRSQKSVKYLLDLDIMTREGEDYKVNSTFDRVALIEECIFSNEGFSTLPLKFTVGSNLKIFNIIKESFISKFYR